VRYDLEEISRPDLSDVVTIFLQTLHRTCR